MTNNMYIAYAICTYVGGHANKTTVLRRQLCCNLTT